MTVIQQELLAATLAINYDVFSQEPFLTFATSKIPRRVRKIGIVGGAGIKDLTCDLYYGSKLIAKNLYNVATGLELHTNQMFPIVGSDVCKADEKIILVVTEAGNTNPYAIKVEIV